MRDVWGEEKHFAFSDKDVTEIAAVNYLEKHIALILIEPFRRLVYMVIGPLIWSTNNLGPSINPSLPQPCVSYHDCHVLVSYAVIVNRRF
jgi:hypothetical protein